MSFRHLASIFRQGLGITRDYEQLKPRSFERAVYSTSEHEQYCSNEPASPNSYKLIPASLSSNQQNCRESKAKQDLRCNCENLES